MMSSISTVSASIRNLEEKSPTYLLPKQAGTLLLNGLLLLLTTRLNKIKTPKIKFLHYKINRKTAPIFRQLSLNKRGIHPKKELTERVRLFKKRKMTLQ